MLFHNPVSETLHIRSAETTINGIAVIDMTGRLVHQEAGNRNTIDVSSFPPGVYQVVISGSGNNQIHRKIIVAH